jgi:hypothetical protein
VIIKPYICKTTGILVESEEHNLESDGIIAIRLENLKLDLSIFLMYINSIHVIITSDKVIKNLIQN